MAEPIEEKHSQVMKALAEGIDTVLNGRRDTRKDEKRATGFMLFVYDFNEGPKAGRMNYISNANRLDMNVAVKEMAAHFEGRLMPQYEENKKS